jgi:hypothetical protein
MKPRRRQGLQLVCRLIDFEQLGLVTPDLGKLLRWAGHNTDWFGFAEGLRRGLPGGRTHMDSVAAPSMAAAC